MSPKWILIANRDSARLFEYLPGPRRWRLEGTREYPRGKLHNRDFEVGKAGTMTQRHGYAHPGLVSEHDNVDHEAEHFGRELGEWLEEKRQQDGAREFILVAEPYFLGRLKAALHDQVSRLVTNSISKDLAHLPEQELASHIDEAILQSPSPNEAR